MSLLRAKGVILEVLIGGDDEAKKPQVQEKGCFAVKDRVVVARVQDQMRMSTHRRHRRREPGSDRSGEESEM